MHGFTNRTRKTLDGSDSKLTVEVEKSLGIEVFLVESIVLLPNFFQLLLVSLMPSSSLNLSFNQSIDLSLNKMIELTGWLICGWSLCFFSISRCSFSAFNLSSSDNSFNFSLLSNSFSISYFLNSCFLLASNSSRSAVV